MRRSIWFGLAFGAILLPIAVAHATPPCIALNKTRFMTQVFTPSDSVVLVQIEAFSNSDRLFRDHWTKVKILKTLHHDKSVTPLDAKEPVTIVDWQAQTYPVFTYAKGDLAILFLKHKNGNEAALTTMDQGNCFPAIWSANADGSVYPQFHDPRAERIDWMHMDALTSLLKKWSKQ